MASRLTPRRQDAGRRATPAIGFPGALGWESGRFPTQPSKLSRRRRTFVARLVVVLFLVVVARGSTAHAANERVYVARRAPREVAVVTSPIVVEMLTAIGSTAITLFERALASSPPPADPRRRGAHRRWRRSRLRSCPRPWRRTSPGRRRRAASSRPRRRRLHARGGDLPAVALPRRQRAGSPARPRAARALRGRARRAHQRRRGRAAGRGAVGGSARLRAGPPRARVGDLLRAGARRAPARRRERARRRGPALVAPAHARSSSWSSWPARSAASCAGRWSSASRPRAPRSSSRPTCPPRPRSIYGTTPGRARSHGPRRSLRGCPRRATSSPSRGCAPPQEIHYQVVTSDERSPVATLPYRAGRGRARALRRLWRRPFGAPTPTRDIVDADRRPSPPTSSSSPATSSCAAPTRPTGSASSPSPASSWRACPSIPSTGNHDVGTSGDKQRRFDDVFLPWPAPAEPSPRRAVVQLRRRRPALRHARLEPLRRRRRSWPGSRRTWRAPAPPACARASRSPTRAPGHAGPTAATPRPRALYAPLLERYGIARHLLGPRPHLPARPHGQARLRGQRRRRCPALPDHLRRAPAAAPAMPPTGPRRWRRSITTWSSRPYRDFARMCPKRARRCAARAVRYGRFRRGLWLGSSRSRSPPSHRSTVMSGMPLPPS